MSVTGDSAQNPPPGTERHQDFATSSRPPSSQMLRHWRPSLWANTESSRITVAECFDCRTWIIADWRCLTASVTRLTPGLRVRHRSIHCLVLLRTPLGFQSYRSRALPHAPGITRSGRQHHQPTTGSRAPPRSRSRRLWFAESRVSRGDQSSERGQTARIPLRQLVERRAEFRCAQACSWR
jgi:hypothetical protein